MFVKVTGFGVRKLSDFAKEFKFAFVQFELKPNDVGVGQ